ncbi:MAG TPA: DUF429 domain-containing protein [Caulobacteraceae bacterium]
MTPGDSRDDEQVFIGIDVACAKDRRLPVCFALRRDGRLEPAELRRALLDRIPRGTGNREVALAAPYAEKTRAVAAAIAGISREMGWRVERIAVDAPAAPGRQGGRRCEIDLFGAGLSAFKTPSVDEWPGVLAACRAHLSGGVPLARLPHANKVWMLYGFELFAALRTSFEVIEVYPFAIARALLPIHAHKSTEEGYRLQLAAIAAATGWAPDALEVRLRRTVAGSRHDRLDAFMAVWVASLPTALLRAFGDASDPNDAIWTPLPASRDSPHARRSEAQAPSARR